MSVLVVTVGLLLPWLVLLAIPTAALLALRRVRRGSRTGAEGPSSSSDEAQPQE